MNDRPQDLPTPASPNAEGESTSKKLHDSSALVKRDGEDQGSVSLTDAPLVLGVNREMLERFLTLIHDYYDKVDKATFFLEMRTGVINVSGITNVRGILSHLVVFLDPNTSDEKRREQLTNAEGHLRRAIEEPYEVAFDSLTVSFQRTYQQYKSEVLPAREKHAFLHSAPNLIMVDARLREIGDLGSTGRAAKDKELSDPAWEVCTAAFVEAFEKLFALKSEIEVYCNAYGTMKEDEVREENLRKQLREEIHDDLARESKHSTLLHYIGIAIGTLGILVAVLLVVFPKFADWVRMIFHVG